MIYLALSVLSSSLIFVVFKLYPRFRVETLFAIIVNYVVACSTGLFFYEGGISLAEVPYKPWFWGTMALGILFIVVFNLMAATAQKVGVSVASVATKMSLAIPVLFGVVVYNEQLGPLKIVGIVLALAAVYFASVKKKKPNALPPISVQKPVGSPQLKEPANPEEAIRLDGATTSSVPAGSGKRKKSQKQADSPKSLTVSKWALLLPLSVFLGSGIIDTGIKFFQEYHIEQDDYPIFSASIFATAAVTGILFILIKSFKKPLKISFRNILGGIALGIPNYFSIYFLLRALQHDSLNSASVFTINNVAIVMFSTLLGIVLFKEQVSAKNWAGIGLAVTSIVLVALF
ncbi:MAG: EamA family transporter [Pricia sp.]